MFTERAHELILTNAGIQEFTVQNGTILYSLTVKKKKKAAKQIPGRFMATITGSTFHASHLHGEHMFLQSPGWCRLQMH